MSRPIWKGYITFGLVNIPVILYSAEKRFDLRFNLIDSRDQSRVRYVRVNEHTGEEVPWQAVVKAFEYDEDNYVMLKEQDMKNIAGDHSKSISIDNFIEKSSLSCMAYEKPYYLVPDKKGEKGYVILREVLKESKKIAIAKVIIHTREYLAAILPEKNALVLELLRYYHEIREPGELDLPSDNLKEYKITAKEIDVANQLVTSMSVPWDHQAYQDEYRLALQKWIDEKIHQGKPRVGKKRSAKPTVADNVINFVDLFKKSLAESQTKSIKNHANYIRTSKKQAGEVNRLVKKKKKAS